MDVQSCSNPTLLIVKCEPKTVTMKNKSILIGITVGAFLGISFLVISLLSNQIPGQNDERQDRPFFAVGDEFENIKTIKSEECFDLVETINAMNPGDQRVELYKIWLEDCIESEPALPSLP